MKPTAVLANPHFDQAIVIVGPTASGKTSLAIKLASKYNGEIISADSRAVYKYMDIGTAKPSLSEQTKVKHWGIDLIEPDQSFTAYDFQQYAIKKINDIKNRGKIPFIVGGSGLYINSIIYGYSFNPKSDKYQRQQLNNMAVTELQDYCKKNNISLPSNSSNKRYLIRTIETEGVVKNNRENLLPGFIVVGITTDKKTLLDRINKRTNQMFSSNIVKETSFLINKYGKNLESMKANIYRVIDDWQKGTTTQEQAMQKNITLDWQLAKRQLTWLKRNPKIKWLSLLDAEKYISGLLH